jgi:hypothetical protein
MAIGHWITPLIKVPGDTSCADVISTPLLLIFTVLPESSISGSPWTA